MQLPDAYVHAFNQLPARHKELSVIASMDDEPAKPTRRLLDLTLAAFGRSLDNALPIFDGRPSSEQRWFDTWPGEHYRLLSAMAETPKASTMCTAAGFADRRSPGDL